MSPHVVPWMLKLSSGAAHLGKVLGLSLKDSFSASTLDLPLWLSDYHHPEVWDYELPHYKREPLNCPKGSMSVHTELRDSAIFHPANP